MSDPRGEQFDALIARLREVVGKLESGDLSLEDSLVAYEEGVQLARRAQQQLAAAEKRVEILVTGEDGQVAIKKFADAGGDDPQGRA